MQVIHKDLIVIDTCDSSWGIKECFVVTRYGQADIPTADWPRPLTSRGISAWPYRVTTSIPFIQYIHTRCWKNSGENGALEWEIQWFDDELFIHTDARAMVHAGIAN